MNDTFSGHGATRPLWYRSLYWRIALGLFAFLALMLTAVLLAATEGRRGAYACWMLNIAGLAFAVGIVLFSGGIYLQILRGVQLPPAIVPTGGIAFMIGWAALALSAFGLRKAQAVASGV